MEKGCFVISLDFELVWGVFDHIDLNYKKQYFDNTLKAIPLILNQFQQYNIAATWATVGMLFNESWEEWRANIPNSIPTYQNQKLNPYAYGENHQKSGIDQYFFAPKLIRTIQSLSGQEIGTHTYSHYYCLEKGQLKEQFDQDLSMAVKMAKKFDVELKSMVFPRNQFNQSYLESCQKYGIMTVRSNPDNWYWDTISNETIFKKLARTGDAYFPIGKKSYKSTNFNEVYCQKASRFFRPQSKYGLLNIARLNRIKNEIVVAAKNGEVYHLWWHPHNFGVDVNGSINALKEILEVYNKCRELYGMNNYTMNQLREISIDV